MTKETSMTGHRVVTYARFDPELLEQQLWNAKDAAIDLVEICYSASYNAGWYHDPATGLPIERNVGERLMLIVSEIAEAMEGHRKNLMDDKLPHRKMLEVELADAIIRICDFAGAEGLDLGGAIAEKIAYNLRREDHKPANRAKEGGKAY